MDKRLTKLQGLGYTIEPTMFADTDEHPTVYHVTGPGVETYVGEKDGDALDSLLASHDERVRWEQLSDEERAAEADAAATDA